MASMMRFRHFYRSSRLPQVIAAENHHIMTIYDQSRSSSSKYVVPPPLPVPDHNTALAKFRDYALAVATPPTLRAHKEDKHVSAVNSMIEKFVRTELPTLQTMLDERASRLPNWLTPWWLDIAYLAGRTPLPVVTSPGVLFPTQWQKTEGHGFSGKVYYATQITSAAIKFFNEIHGNKLKQDFVGNKPMDMSQYYYLFGTTRVPAVNKDVIKYGVDIQLKPGNERHIIVIHNGHICKVPVTQNGQFLSSKAIALALSQVVSMTDFPNSNQIGILSSDNRDKWAQAYTELKNNKVNAKNLTEIENSLFVVCLDKVTTPLPGSSKKDEQARAALHGCGSKKNSGNRWFDKTIQFVINDDGLCGMTYEHTPAEGPPVAAMMDYIWDHIEKDDCNSGSATGELKPERLDFVVNDKIKLAIENAAQSMDKVVDDLEVKTYTFNSFGKNIPKQIGVSPDSFIQIAFQVAYYRIHNKMPPTYETATLRLFAEGRTENIRLPNTITRDFCELISRANNLEAPIITDAFKAAINSHKKIAQDCMNGSGVDRLLLAWKLIAAENGLPKPSILQSKEYEEMMHFRVSTSQVPTKNFIQMCFGPAEADCYGICYNPQETVLHFAITTFNRDASTSATRFAKELEAALLDLKTIGFASKRDNKSKL